MTVDPARAGFSSYWGMNNNPIYYADPDGRCPDPSGNSDFFNGGQSFTPEGSSARYMLTDPSAGRDGWVRISDPMLDVFTVTSSDFNGVLDMGREALIGFVNSALYISSVTTMLILNTLNRSVYGGNLSWAKGYTIDSR